jgi:hypothetical protein
MLILLNAYNFHNRGFIQFNQEVFIAYLYVHTERRYTRVAFAPCLTVVYTFLPIKVLSLVFRGVISSLPPPCYIGKYTIPSPYRREELIANTATLVYLLSAYIYCSGNKFYKSLICSADDQKNFKHVSVPYYPRAFGKLFSC